MMVPHERFDDLWVEAFANCQNISEFRWRSTLPVPDAILAELSSKRKLRILTIPADALSTTPQVEQLARTNSLEQLTLLAPDREFRTIMVGWINSMSHTLTRLHIEVRCSC